MTTTYERPSDATAHQAPSRPRRRRRSRLLLLAPVGIAAAVLLTGPSAGADPGRGDHTGGTVSSVNGRSFTVARPDGSSTRVTTSSATTFMKTVDGTVADAAPGTHVGAQGTRAADGTFTAEHVGVHPAPPANRPAPPEGERPEGDRPRDDRHLGGEVVSNDGTRITVKTRSGEQAVIATNSATKVTKTVAGAFSDVTRGRKVMAHGTRSADGSLAADKVHVNASSSEGPRPGGPGGPGRRGPGGPRR
ncbi:MAG TPA: DUF5666 domain-containing protein [Acidimicrobiales bacterium]|nr:DUF5666 domain-containing protein [Acidimicrobiales bacterium]